MIVVVGGPDHASGKTTLAVHLADYFAVQEQSVLVVDAEQNDGATNWEARASQLPPTFRLPRVMRLREHSIRSTLARAAPFDMVFVDMAPGVGSVWAEAIEVADVVLLPACGARAEDDALLRAAQALARKREERPSLVVAILQNRVEDGERGATNLELPLAAGIPVLKASLKEYPVLSRAFALGRGIMTYALSDTTPEDDLSSAWPAAIKVAEIAEEIVLLHARRGLSLVNGTPTPKPRSSEMTRRRDAAVLVPLGTQDALQVLGDGHRSEPPCR